MGRALTRLSWLGYFLSGEGSAGWPIILRAKLAAALHHGSRFLFSCGVWLGLSDRQKWIANDERADGLTILHRSRGWCRRTDYRSLAAVRSNVKPAGRGRRSLRNRSIDSSRLRSRAISNSRGPAILTSIWSPSLGSKTRFVGGIRVPVVSHGCP
jgi:hypothetical protein